MQETVETTSDRMTLSEAMERLKKKHRPDDENLSSDKEETSSRWDLNTSFGGAKRLAKEGWAEGSTLSRKQLEKLREFALDESKLHEIFTGEGKTSVLTYMAPLLSARIGVYEKTILNLPDSAKLSEAFVHRA